MILTTVKVRTFKSIGKEQTMTVDPAITVLVGMNEAGKTVILQAMEKAEDVLGQASFDPVDDYPRRDLPAYLKRHKAEPASVVTLTYRLDKDEVALLNADCNTKVKEGFEFSLDHKYDNTRTLHFSIDERPIIEAAMAKARLSGDAKTALRKVQKLREIPGALEETNLTADDTAFKEAIEQRIAATKWPSVGQYEVWEWLKAVYPKFLYFSDYDLLPSKMNLADLAAREARSATDRKQLEPKHRAVLALLRMADIAVADFKAGGYEPLKAKIEGVSIALTDQILEFWKQNEDLEVEVDIKPDPEDEAPFNNGPNLYLRIKNKRHRGVSTPFQQRSRGFIWFFSFLVWFDSVQHQLGAEDNERGVILLLDEPGLALHALAQADFLKYIESLAKKHQVLYTTHSPFMVASAKLDRVRVVEDRRDQGTVVSENLGGSDPKTIFPLQAALGWTIAQNLFINERNLLVEGPSDLIYLKGVSTALEALGRTALREDVLIVPVGGLDKVATFVALLGANDLQLAVLHDYKGAPDQRIMDLVKSKMLSHRAVMTAAQFRTGGTDKHSDTEDLFEVEEYLDCFNRAFAKQLGKKIVKASDLPPGDRILDRLERALSGEAISLRPSGGFNHYAVASAFATQLPKLSEATLARFEALFKTVNALF